MRYLVFVLLLGGCCDGKTVRYRTSCLFSTVRSSTRESVEWQSKQSEDHWRLTYPTD